jgi:ribonuclease P protein component
MMKKEGFSKSIRIKKKKEWEEVVKKGERFFGVNLSLLRLKTEGEKIKLGIGIRSGIKGAVKRNRIKRLLREVIRKNKDKFSPGEKVILTYRSKEVDISYQELLNEFLKLVTNLKNTDA